MATQRSLIPDMVTPPGAHSIYSTHGGGWMYNQCRQLRRQTYDASTCCGVGLGSVGHGRRRIRSILWILSGHVFEGRTSDSAEELSDLSSARADCAHVVAHLSGCASMGEGDQGCGGCQEDAPLVRGPEVRAFRERSVFKTK